MTPSVIAKLGYSRLAQRLDEVFPRGDDKQNRLRREVFSLVEGVSRARSFPPDDDSFQYLISKFIQYNVLVKYLAPLDSRARNPYYRPRMSQYGYRVTLETLTAACDRHFPGCGVRLARVLWRQYAKRDGKGELFWSIPSHPDEVEEAIRSEEWAPEFYANKVRGAKVVA